MTKYNIVAIDPSIVSTAIVVNEKCFNYCKQSKAETSKKKLTKWFDLCKDIITYRYIDTEQSENYSENEILKMLNYDNTTDLIIKDIVENIDNTLPTKIIIEGFSYSSSSGDIIDLVTFSTLLRRKLLTITDPKHIEIIAPSSLKLESCKMTYKPIEKVIGGKNPRTEYIYRNPIGIAGGNFTKTEIAQSLIDNNNQTVYCNFLRQHKTAILFTKQIQKPLEDMNDAFTMYLLMIAKYTHC